MSLIAVCPRCHVENVASNVQCDACGTALGLVLIDEKSNLTSLLGAGGLTAALLLFSAIIGAPIFVAVSLFYGALVPSYLSRNNVVWHAAIGAVLGALVMFIMTAFIYLKTAKAITALVVSKPGDLAVLFVGTMLVAVAVLPVALMGASVGELLSQRRRERRLAAIAAADPLAPTREPTDDELAKIEL